ncbi:transcriptional regulator, LysR family (plasmid) [Rhizorhabdus wittichii RW1]|uniref:Transcriptional regulator, LysR family n=1 Tax=Rhizorhabdus wittichii (strain DSM 6014 / CCUG 31198 / JCM 15750 / NBRC 105917 / EY 4224 / RW1) TaxID=392499 RepID=A0A9J9HHL2_RHIWR|nr:transcriptional regulator, LysR family [Rhizorhabdus wittichii RW1]
MIDFSERRLRAFMEVVEARSIGRAAIAMNMSQSALSRLIQALEEMHGIDLFQRLPTGVVLTPAGEALVPHARLLLFEMRQASDSLQAIRGLKRGVARVGAVAAITRSILPGAVRRMLDETPGLLVQVTDSLDDRLASALTGNQIDLMISGKVELQGEIHLVGECQFDDTYSIICANDHALAKASTVSIADVLSLPWVMPPLGATPRVLFEDIVRRLGMEMPAVDIESSSPNAIASFVIGTGRLGWMPTPLFTNELSAGSVHRIRIAEFELARRFFIYRRAKGLLPAPARELVRHLPMVGRDQIQQS